MRAKVAAAFQGNGLMKRQRQWDRVGDQRVGAEVFWRADAGGATRKKKQTIWGLAVEEALVGPRPVRTPP